MLARPKSSCRVLVSKVRGAKAGTNALEHEAGIAKVHDWFGHANIVTTRIYDSRKSRAEHSPIFKGAP